MIMQSPNPSLLLSRKKNFYTTEAELLTAAQEYVDFYNNYIPHQRLDFITPDQVEAEYNEKTS